MTLFFMSFILLLVGVYTLITKKNLFKLIIGSIIIEYAVYLFIILIGYRKGATDPLLTQTITEVNIVDPLAQSITIVYILIGLAALCLMIALAARIYEKYETLDINKIKKLRG